MQSIESIKISAKNSYKDKRLLCTKTGTFLLEHPVCLIFRIDKIEQVFLVTGYLVGAEAKIFFVN